MPELLARIFNTYADRGIEPTTARYILYCTYTKPLPCMWDPA